MTTSCPRLWTIGSIAQHFGVRDHQAKFAARRIGAKPAASTGTCFVYSPVEVERIGAELARIRQRRGERISAAPVLGPLSLAL